MITPKDQVSMMFGIGVAEQLDEAGLLVKNTELPKSQYGNPTHWMVRCQYDRIGPLNGVWAPHSLDMEMKYWWRRLGQMGPHRFEKVWSDENKYTATRMCSMVNNGGKPVGITATLIPVRFVEVT